MAERSYWERIEQKRISRRRVLAGTGVGAAGLLVAAACGSSKGGGNTPSASGTTGTPSPTGPTPTPQPGKRGGRYLGVNQGAWGTIDPIVSVGNATGIMPRFYNTLISRSNVDPSFTFYDMATSFEQPDEVTYIFHMRPGIKIAPNNLGIPERDMNAQDAVGYFDRIVAEADAIERKFTQPYLDTYTATADTFTLKTKGPYAYTLSTIGRALGGCIPPRETWDKHIDLKSAEAGGGPFMVKQGTYQESGSVSLDRNPNYYRKDDVTGTQLPFWDGIDVALVSDVQARKTGFLGKQIYEYGAQDAKEANSLVSSNPDLYIVKSPTFTFISWTMNPTKKPWDDDRIRQAAQHALNRQQFVDLIVGNGEGHPDGLVPWDVGQVYAFSDAELNTDARQKYDPQKSKQLIKAATGNDSISVKIVYPVSDIEFHDKHLPIFLQQVQQAGFNVQQDSQDFTTWLGNYTNVNYDSSLSLNQIYYTPEIDLDWQSSKGPAGTSQFAIGVGKLHPEVDQAIAYSKQATTLNELATRVKAAQDVAYKYGPSFLPIMSWYTFTLYWNFVKNVPNLGDTGTFLSTEWLDL